MCSFLVVFFKERFILQDIVVGISRPQSGEFEDDESQTGANARLYYNARCRFGEKVHVVKACGATTEHFRDG